MFRWLRSKLDQCQLWFGTNRWDTFRHVVFLCPWMVSAQVLQSVFIPSPGVSSCWLWMIGGNRVITLGTAVNSTSDNTKLRMGSTIGVVLIRACSLPCRQREKGENDEKDLHFYLALSFWSSYLPFYLIFYAFNKGEIWMPSRVHAWHFNGLFADGHLMLILSETFLWPSCQPWLRQWLEPLEPSIFTNKKS